MPIEGEVREFAIPADPDQSNLRLIFQKRIFDGDKWLIITNETGGITPECDRFVDEYLQRCKNRIIKNCN